MEAVELGSNLVAGPSLTQGSGGGHSKSTEPCAIPRLSPSPAPNPVSFPMWNSQKDASRWVALFEFDAGFAASGEENMVFIFPNV